MKPRSIRAQLISANCAQRRKYKTCINILYPGHYTEEAIILLMQKGRQSFVKEFADSLILHYWQRQPSHYPYYLWSLLSTQLHSLAYY